MGVIIANKNETIKLKGKIAEYESYLKDYMSKTKDMDVYKGFYALGLL